MAPHAPTQAAPAHGAGLGRFEARRGSRAEYVATFFALLVLLVVELFVATVGGIPKAPRVVALVAIAVSKAALIGLFFMHLRSETRILKLTVFGPLLAPAVYGIVLIADATWRLLR